MTYPPPYQPQTAAPWPAIQPQPAPAVRRQRRWLLPVIIGAVVIVLLAAGGTATAVYLANRDKLTQATAQRACRTAVESEWSDRQTMTATARRSILVSTQSIDLDETWQTDTGWSVNATVRYSLTTWPIDPVQNTLALTCVASGKETAPVTSVSNRQ